MSTFKEIISRVNEMKPNVFSQKTKLNWLTSLNGKLAADIFLMDIAEIRVLPQGDAAEDCEPLVGFPHEEIYEEYLIAKIDAANGEAREYQNRMQLYDAYYTNFVAWFKSTYDPVQGDPSDHGLNPKLPTYYITAYGMAVMCGYRGTIQEWLESLNGVSPVARQEEIPGGHRLIISHANGETAFDVMDGAGNVSSVNGVLPYPNGNVDLTAKDVKAIGINDTAAAAKKLETARKLQTNLGSDESESFDGSGDVKLGVTGILPLKNGGHGASDAETARKNLGAQKQYKKLAITLPASGWANNSLTVAVADVTADNDVDVSPAPASHAPYCEAGVHCAAQTAGGLTFTCLYKPDVSLTVNLRIWD